MRKRKTAAGDGGQRRRRPGGQWQMRGWFPRSWHGAGRRRTRTKRGTRWPAPGCILLRPAPLQPGRLQWASDTSPAYSHHSGFITLFSRLIHAVPADTALFKDDRGAGGRGTTDSHQCFNSEGHCNISGKRYNALWKCPCPVHFLHICTGYKRRQQRSTFHIGP